MFTRKRKRIRFATSGVSKTEQKWRDRQNVNNIVERCLRGDDSGLKACGFQFADITEVPATLQDMLNYRMNASAAFDSLCVEAREHYGTPSRFLNALHDENEIPNLRKFGLLKPEVKDTPV